MDYPEEFLETVRVFQYQRADNKKFIEKLLEVYDNGHFAEYAKELNLHIYTIIDLVRIAGPNVDAMKQWLETPNNSFMLEGVPPREMLNFPNGEFVLRVLMRRIERDLYFERFDWVQEKERQLGTNNLLKDWDKE
ncbi:MAG: hypothetical protein GXP05_03970 [Alphaproteobacteria bacterium]|nr:hypothetical protein [Alphaproteobacteria bacterium]